VILLDTTVLVYAVGDDHPLREPARGLIRAISQGHLAGTTTVEVVQEFCHVRARRRGRTDAVALARDVTRILSPLMAVTADDLDRGLALFERDDDLGSFDAVLAATVLRSGTTLVSADRAFAGALGSLFLDLASDPVERLTDR
jgi:uncharacterized protein